jgi:hypothetical protein
MDLDVAKQAKIASEAALHGKSTDTRDWVTRHKLAAMAFDQAVGTRPQDPRAAFAKAIAAKHRVVAKLIERWDQERTEENKNRVLMAQNAISQDLINLKAK